MKTTLGIGPDDSVVSASGSVGVLNPGEFLMLSDLTRKSLTQTMSRFRDERRIPSAIAGKVSGVKRGGNPNVPVTTFVLTGADGAWVNVITDCPHVRISENCVLHVKCHLVRRPAQSVHFEIRHRGQPPDLPEDYRFVRIPFKAPALIFETFGVESDLLESHDETDWTTPQKSTR